MKSHWREKAKRVIEKSVTDSGLNKDEIPQFRQKLRAAYPFGERKRWPYKVWCEEVRRTLGLPVRNYRAEYRNRPKVYTDEEIMPCMREWARDKGLLK